MFVDDTVLLEFAPLHAKNIPGIQFFQSKNDSKTKVKQHWGQLIKMYLSSNFLQYIKIHTEIFFFTESETLS